MTRDQDFLATLGAEPDRGRQKKKQKATPEKKERQFSVGSFELHQELGAFVKERATTISLFLALSVFVTVVFVNAVFLQDSKHPTPMFADYFLAPTKVADVAIPRPREIILADEGTVPRSNPLVADIQFYLAKRGYYNAEIDGLMGARTQAAVGLYQRTFALEVTNEASHVLLDHIRLSNPDRSYHAKRREQLAAKSEVQIVKANTQRTTEVEQIGIDDPARIKQVQRALTKLGYDLTDDGIAGKNTKSAIIDFKKKRGLKSDGSINVALLNELIKLKQL